MNVSGNVTFYAGAKANTQTKDTRMEETKKKGLEKGAFFAGELNKDLFANKILEKKKEAQKKAMRVVGDAWESDRQIDEDLQERRDLISTLHQENQQAQSRINEINQRQEALKEEYGITEDSQEQKDLELLRREKQMLTNPESGERLSMDELKYVWKLREEGLTDYQQKQLSLDGEKSHFQSIIDANQKTILEETAIIRGVRQERLKHHTMVEARNQAEEILDAASREIMGMLMEEAKEYVDEKSEENQEKAEKLEEKQEQMEEFIEAQKEKQDETEEIWEEIPVEEILDMGQLKDEVKQEVKKIISNMNLVVEDIKGAMVDESL